MPTIPVFLTFQHKHVMMSSYFWSMFRLYSTIFKCDFMEIFPIVGSDFLSSLWWVVVASLCFSFWFLVWFTLVMINASYWLTVFYLTGHGLSHPRSLFPRGWGLPRWSGMAFCHLADVVCQCPALPWSHVLSTHFINYFDISNCNCGFVYFSWQLDGFCCMLSVIASF